MKTIINVKLFKMLNIKQITLKMFENQSLQFKVFKLVLMIYELEI